MAKKAHKPTEQNKRQVKIMVAAGIEQPLMAKILGISASTLKKYYKAELAIGKAEVVTAVAAALYKKAMSGNVTAQIFMLKTRGGWRETERLEHTGADGKSLIPELVISRLDVPEPAKD